MSTQQQNPPSSVPPSYEFVVPAQSAGKRLDRFLAGQLPDYSRARIQQWITQEAVLLNGQPTRPRQTLQADDQIWVQVQPSAQEQALQPENLPLEEVYESRHVIVVNKAVGRVVHPGAGNWSGTLLNALLYHYPELQDLPRAGIVHRLDKDTSGLMMVARSSEAVDDLGKQLKARTVQRVYKGVCQGALLGQGQITTPIVRDPRVAVRMAARDLPGARTARTDYMVLGSGRLDEHPVTEVQCRLHTGRTHQIRVHLSSIGHPLLGDGLYKGLHIGGATRQMLHAYQLGFVEPQTKKNLSFECAPPADYQQVRAQIVWTN